MEINLNNRTAQVELVSRQGNVATLRVDGKTYKIDIARVEDNVYSVLLNGLSFNIEIIPGENPRLFQVNTYRFSYETEMVDAETRYRRNRNKSLQIGGDKSVVAPMPGRVVRVFVKPGDEVESGQTLLILSAMKMESEFKARVSGKVRHVNVNEGDTVEGKQVLVVID